MDQSRRKQTAYPPKPLTPKPRVKANVSKFEKAVYGIRNQEWIRDLSQVRGPTTAKDVDRLRGYGIVASLCTRFMQGEGKQARLADARRRGSPRIRRKEPPPDTFNQSKPRIRHQEVIRQLLGQAIESSDFALLNVIIRMSPSVKNYLEDTDENGNTLLHRSCKDSKNRLAVVLVELGLDVNRQGEQNRTPLHLAALQNDIHIVRLLLNSCADVFVKDAEGFRPVDLCSDCKVRSLLLMRMNARSRSFNAKRSKWNYCQSDNDINLSRTDSGIVMENVVIFDNAKIVRTKQAYSRAECLSSFRDFWFSKETIV